VRVRGHVFHPTSGLDAQPTATAQAKVRRRAARASLHARICEVFPRACPFCGTGIRFIAFITDPARIRDIEAARDPQLAHRALLDRADESSPVVPVAAFRFAHDGPRLDARAPAVGEHSDAILREAGVTADEIAALRAAGVVA